MALSEEVLHLREQILDDFELSPAELAVLDKGLEALNMANEAQAELDSLGSMFYVNRLGEPTQHPAVRVKKDAQAQFAAAFKQLGLADPYGGSGGHGRGAQKARK